MTPPSGGGRRAWSPSSAWFRGRPPFARLVLLPRMAALSPVQPPSPIAGAVGLQTQGALRLRTGRRRTRPRHGALPARLTQGRAGGGVPSARGAGQPRGLRGEGRSCGGRRCGRFGRPLARPGAPPRGARGPPVHRNDGDGRGDAERAGAACGRPAHGRSRRAPLASPQPPRPAGLVLEVRPADADAARARQTARGGGRRCVPRVTDRVLPDQHRGGRHAGAPGARGRAVRAVPRARPLRGGRPLLAPAGQGRS